MAAFFSEAVLKL